MRALAAASLAAPAPAVLLRLDGSLIAANAGGGALLGRLPPPDEVSAAAARIAATLRPGRPARLERLRLAGRLTPTTLACSLLAAGSARALLMISLDAAPASRPTPSPEAEAPVAPPATEAAPAPLRFTWRTDLQARFTQLDARLAETLEQPADSLIGRDWSLLGALDAHRAILEGRSFTRLPVLLRTPRGDALEVELGGAPVRGEGMRGYGLVKGRRPLPPGASTLPHLPPVMAPASVAPTPVPPPPAPVGPPPVLPPEPVVEAPRAPVAEPEEPTPVRVTLSIVPSSPNVVPLRGPAENGVRTSWEGLSTGERNAFREIARALGARLEGVEDFPEPARPSDAPASTVPATEQDVPAKDTPAPAIPAETSWVADPAETAPLPAPEPARREPDGLQRLMAEGERPILDRLPVGLLAFRGDRLLYANRALLEWIGHPDLAAIEQAGGLATLFTGAMTPGAENGRTLSLAAADGGTIAVDARLMSSPWEGGTAMLYVLHRSEPVADAAGEEKLRQAELALREAETASRELRSILDTATDGVVLIDAAGTVLSMNHPAEALFGFSAPEVTGENFTLLFAPESQRAAVDYLDGLAANGVASVLNDGREVIGRVREGGLIPLFMTIGRVGEDATKFCAVLRDITQWKRAEEELTEAKRLAERANMAKSDFLAKISHEIRTPLNAIIGFSEVMMEERFGAIENQRYRDYLRDIHASGGHLISLINDLLDLSKIEAGKLDLAFTSVPLNEIVQQSMAIMQPQANRERIIIRSSLASELPPVVADARSIRQIVLNLVSNSIKFTRPGGQVILSTAFTEEGEVVLRVRDTGIGMSEADISVAMEPFRQLATSGRAGSGGTGLGLPLTKALAEANRASFNIRSAVDVGTIVEITFPSTRVLAE
ncbi:histidine kinase dimerization/phospho-acceptor domain-containing protein [Ancylobacter sp. WKF20]|uniref:ATP-binding protein n=1 Tax=Ancylobacter sp. WKF20 TaxID=3039801 RepID=UPI002434622B|nr:ATP-binding protein [Ancylobacter sp. WKF20]WGD30312.1 histidine kinase dimerization/phospho-acceptor domain-containing protein [Ancylobacter sp. WKF20]